MKLSKSGVGELMSFSCKSRIIYSGICPGASSNSCCIVMKAGLWRREAIHNLFVPYLCISPSNQNATNPFTEQLYEAANNTAFVSYFSFPPLAEERCKHHQRSLILKTRLFGRWVACLRWKLSLHNALEGTTCILGKRRSNDSSKEQRRSWQASQAHSSAAADECNGKHLDFISPKPHLFQSLRNLINTAPKSTFFAD